MTTPGLLFCLLLASSSPAAAQDETEIPDQQPYVESNPGEYAPGHGPNDQAGEDPPVPMQDPGPALPNDSNIRQEAASERRPPAGTGTEGKPEKLGPMTLSGARINWPTVVESYVARHSARGVWTLRDKAGRTWRLKLAQTLGDTVRRTGKGLYAGHALLRTSSAPLHKLDMEFTVDFSGADWKVKAYRIHKIDGRLRS